jgi:hypothetical protein
VLIAALGAAGFTRRAELRALAENVLRRAPATLPLSPTVAVAAEPAPTLTAPVAPPIAPSAASAASIEVVPADSLDDARATPGHAKRPAHVPAARDVKSPKSPPAARPAAKPAASRPHDSEAEQYGI